MLGVVVWCGWVCKCSCLCVISFETGLNVVKCDIHKCTSNRHVLQSAVRACALSTSSECSNTEKERTHICWLFCLFNWRDICLYLFAGDVCSWACVYNKKMHEHTLHQHTHVHSHGCQWGCSACECSTLLIKCEWECWEKLRGNVWMCVCVCCGISNQSPECVIVSCVVVVVVELVDKVNRTKIIN